MLKEFRDRMDTFALRATGSDKFRWRNSLTMCNIETGLIETGTYA